MKLLAQCRGAPRHGGAGAGAGEGSRPRCGALPEEGPRRWGPRGQGDR